MEDDVSERLVMKVLCGACGTKIGEVYRGGPEGPRFRPVPGNGGHWSVGDSLTAPRFWCRVHGFATDTDEIGRAAVEAPDGKVTTRRARMPANGR